MKLMTPCIQTFSFMSEVKHNLIHIMSYYGLEEENKMLVSWKKNKGMSDKIADIPVGIKIKARI